MQWLAEICVRRPVFATVLILSLVVVGAFGYTRLGVDRFPKVDFPIVTITVREDGASPEEIETDVVDKVEEARQYHQRHRHAESPPPTRASGRSSSRSSWKRTSTSPSQEVRDKVSGVIPDLPLDIKSPVVDKVDPDASPILNIALSAPGNIRDITEYADKVLRRQIESINGVGQVPLLGGRKRQINVILDPVPLRAYNLTSADVQRALETQNIQVPGGQVDQGTRKLTLRTQGRVQTPDDFDDIVIAHKNGADHHASAISARVEDGTEEAADHRQSERRPDRPAVDPQAVRPEHRRHRRRGQGAAGRYQEDRCRPAIKLRIVRDQSALYPGRHRRRQGASCRSAAFWPPLVVLLFLWNFRTTLISGIAIPASIISTFALMYCLDFTLNSLTLLALTLSVGIVIDDAIVVLENIYRFIEEKGMNPFEAAIEGTREIGLAVLATTLSLIAVFLPVAFMTGIVGRFLNSFGMTMAFAIVVSLLVSFTLTPMLASRWIKAEEDGRPSRRDTTACRSACAEEDGLLPDATRRDGITMKAPSRVGFFKPIDAVYTVLLRSPCATAGLSCWPALAALFSIGLLGCACVPRTSCRTTTSRSSRSAVRAAGRHQPDGDGGPRAIRSPPRYASCPAWTIRSDHRRQCRSRPKTWPTIFVKLKDVDKRTDGYTQQDVMQMARTQVLPQYGTLRTSVGPGAGLLDRRAAAP